MLQIQHLPIDSLRPAQYNPRKISGEQMQRLKRSLTEFGFVDPVILNTQTGNIVGGHQRVAAAKALGYETVPVVEVELDEDREKALNVALNKQGGEWDYQLLPDLLQEIQAGGIDLELTGFTQDDLDRLVAESVEVVPGKTDANSEWDGMPEFISNDETGFARVIVHFETDENLKDFAALVGQGINKTTKSIWYPFKAKYNLRSNNWADTDDEEE